MTNNLQLKEMQMNKIQAEIKALRENTERFKAQAEALSNALQQSKDDFDKRAAELEARLVKAKGTADVTREAKEAVPTPPSSDTTHLTHMVEDLVRERPMTLQELHEATYTADGTASVAHHKQTICNILVKMQRERKGLVNLANQHRALWFIPNQEILDRLRKIGD